MKSNISLVSVVGAAVLGCVLCGGAAFGLLVAAFSVQWPIAAAVAVLMAVVGLSVGFAAGRSSRANGRACAVALAAPSLLLGLYFAIDLVGYLVSTPVEPGVPVAALVFLAFTALLAGPAFAGAHFASKPGA